MYCLWPSMTFDTTIFYADEFLSHRHSPGHPESPGRLQAVLTGLSQYGYPDGFLRAAPATITQLCSVHDRSYVEGILQRTLHEVDEETPVYNSTFMIASLSAGAAVSALNSSVERGKPSLALVRPPAVSRATRDYLKSACEREIHRYRISSYRMSWTAQDNT